MHLTRLLQLLRKYGGSPLHIAINLDIPQAAAALLLHGSSLTAEWEARTLIST